MDQRKRQKEKAAGRNWARGADPYLGDRIITDMVHGEFDWRDWFDRRPSSAFMDGVFEQLEYEETMRNAPRENPHPRTKRVIRADEIHVGDLLRGQGLGPHRWNEVERISPHRIPELVWIRIEGGYNFTLPRSKAVTVKR